MPFISCGFGKRIGKPMGVSVDFLLVGFYLGLNLSKSRRNKRGNSFSDVGLASVLFYFDSPVIEPRRN
jgi:hypothetical protein